MIVVKSNRIHECQLPAGRSLDHIDHQGGLDSVMMTVINLASSGFHARGRGQARN